MSQDPGYQIAYTVVDRNVLEHITRELGMQFVLIKDELYFFKQCSNPMKLDPDVVYLLATGSPIRYHPEEWGELPVDAILHWKGRLQPICWGEVTVAAFRKILQQNVTTCAVYREACQTHRACSQCGGTICLLCTFRYGLKEEAFLRFQHGDFKMHLECFECRLKYFVDPRMEYCGVLDRLEEFPKEQQKMLLFLKAMNPNHEEKVVYYKMIQDDYNNVRRRMFRKGCKVELIGLKSKMHLNKKKATIIGAMQIKQEVIRWPVELEGSGKKCLLKQCNMKKVQR